MPILRVAGSYRVGKHPNSAASLLRRLMKPKKPKKPKRTSKFKGTGGAESEQQLGQWRIYVAGLGARE
jgi:hypothetical protein